MDDDLLDDLLSWKDASAPSKSGLSTSHDSINVRLGESPKKQNRSSPAPPLLPNDEGDVALVNTVTETKHPPLDLPSEVTEKLFDYQLEGIQWLYRKHRTGRACLLADEMGLGKTVQVCTFLGALFKQKMIKTAILVVPPTLVPMWTAALEKWGELSAPLVEVLHNDTKAKRQARWRRLAHGLPIVFLTTYGVLRQDVRQMGAQMVDYVILDEAHLIKDASTQASKSAMELSARHKIALTGTPLMNSFEDMWSLFCFLDGGILGQTRADFRAINHILLRGNERDASTQQRGEAEAELNKLQAAILPYMLRREKRDVQAVRSAKEDTVVWVRLTETQRVQYEAFLHTKEVEASRDSEAGPNPLVLLTMLGQICNHPWLNLMDGALRDALLQPFVAPCEAVGDILSGAKLCVALALITRAINEGRKVLVFSRSKVLLSLLARRLQDWLVPHTRIDGDCNSEDRFARVDDFNRDASLWVCLLTTQVGGVGLTFDSASCVILMDPSWNPSADAQAVDRVHRIGQTRDVRVYRLVTSGTVEEKIYRNQVFKTMAAKQSTTSAEQNSDLFRYFTRIQLRSMFDLGDLEHSETAEQLAQLHPGKVSAEMLRLPEEIPLVCGVSDNGCVLCEDVALDESEAEIEEAFQLAEGGSGSGSALMGRRGARSRSSTPPPPSRSTASPPPPVDSSNASSQPWQAIGDGHDLKRRRTEAMPRAAPVSEGEIVSMVAELESATAALVQQSTRRADVASPEAPAPSLPAPMMPQPVFTAVAEPSPGQTTQEPDQADVVETRIPIPLQASTEHRCSPDVAAVATLEVPPADVEQLESFSLSNVSADDEELEDPAQPHTTTATGSSPQKRLGPMLQGFRHLWSSS